MKPLRPPESLYLEAPEGWVGLGNCVGDNPCVIRDPRMSVEDFKEALGQRLFTTSSVR
ncbi:MAG: hypothetical protein ACLQM8_12665 [Limisphaerales bacterium]